VQCLDTPMAIAVISELAGAGVTGFVAVWLDRKSRGRERRSIAVALQAEMRVIITTVNTVMKGGAEPDADAVNGYIGLRDLKTPAFDALAGDVGVLDKETTELILAFYKSLRENAPKAEEAADGRRAGEKLRKRKDKLERQLRRAEELKAALHRAVG